MTACHVYTLPCETPEKTDCARVLNLAKYRLLWRSRNRADKITSQIRHGSAH